ncbi:MAG: protein-export membrane protein SecD [Deltaproteobacteria bacterium RIFCSPLOWO2_02_FULL_50_16]|nr:MAG: protein-export membrane protein SecD [Deltaproteobacteria bacterium RIFCSPHIGHO2_02_FULL_50_15]OGQ58301.1 MAG: protein-export membrane protein SecD [Deltaproteobacteria bacterium RIFCSPLOWO2_02_FULL_50_16]OGQ66633.1 MAG: protein-export membrane protein SecD [Deltaproteobacteria bacterium RIFCSPLOWO2_12_FULL_50_11]
MPSQERRKFILIFIIILVSVYVLMPTLLQWGTKIDFETQDTEVSQDFWRNLLPKKTLNLGLDLKGGLYIELEVLLKDALKNRTDLLANEIEHFLKNDTIAYQQLERLPDTYNIKITYEKPENRDPLLRFMNQYYRDTFQEERSGEGNNAIIYHITEAFGSRIKDQTVKQAVETIRNRIDRYGVSEPGIQRLGANKIAIELPGISDPDRAISIIKTSGKLEFKIVDESMKPEEVLALVNKVREENKIPEGYAATITHQINELTKDKIASDAEISFELQYDPLTRKIVGGTPYLLKRKADVTGDMLRNAQVQVRNNEPYALLSFNKTGTKAFADLTKANVGKRLAIILDDYVNKAPVIQSEIPGGEAQITLGYGNYQDLMKEAEDLVLVLREGALPAKLEEQTKTIVGPTLGKESIAQSSKAFLMGSLLVILFMAIYYKRSGILADIAVLLNVVFIFSILAMFQATLTLPGLAGIILTIGMAVDANVIVFERIRDEIRAGKSPKAALAAGYENAMSAIVDSNVTTFLAGLVLYQFGTGPVRGFAVTLMIGIISTLFTALFVVRTLQDFFMRRQKREVMSI